MQHHHTQSQQQSSQTYQSQYPQNLGERLHKSRTVRYEDTQPTTSNDTTRSTTITSRSSQHRPRGSTRSTSMGGGVQVVLNEQASWSEMANSGQGMVDAEMQAQVAAAGNAKQPGMLGFLNRKKGRDRSPKGKQRERGVLGKEGARHVVSHG